MTESTDNQELLRIKFHSFTLGDVDDVEIYAAQPIYEWQQTPPGKWAMAHARDLTWRRDLDINTMGHRITVYGYLDPRLATEYILRYSGCTKA
jgi:hypothetical protein